MKKRTPMQRIRRWKKRMVRRYSWAMLAFAIGEAAAGCLLVVLVLALILRAAHSGDDTGIDQRAEAQARIGKGLVFVNNAPCLKAEHQISEGDRLTVRGVGRARIETFGGTSRKGRIFLGFVKNA